MLSPELMSMCLHWMTYSFIRHLFDKSLQKKSNPKFLTSENNAWVMETTSTLEMETL